MKRILTILTVLLVLTTAASAQDYKTGLGLRGGYPSGVTVKHFFAKKSISSMLLEPPKIKKEQLMLFNEPAQNQPAGESILAAITGEL